MKRIIVSSMCAIAMSGCALTPETSPTVSLGEAASGYTYVPLDGLAVNQVDTADSCAGRTPPPYKGFLESLPDISVRFAVAQTSGDADLGFGPVKFTSKGSSYKAVLDYVNNDTVPVSFLIRKKIYDKSGTYIKDIPLSAPIDKDQHVGAYEARLNAMAGRKVNTLSPTETANYTEVTFPVYVGIGLRVTANVVALKSGLTISSLGGIGADADKLSGGLIVQTIGINGAIIAGAIPTPSKLDQTTVENAILAVGSGRTAIYAHSDNSQVSLTPRVVGLYSPIGSEPALINAIYSELARTRPEWRRPCTPVSSPGTS